MYVGCKVFEIEKKMSISCLLWHLFVIQLN